MRALAPAPCLWERARNSNLARSNPKYDIFVEDSDNGVFMLMWFSLSFACMAAPFEPVCNKGGSVEGGADGVLMSRIRSAKPGVGRLLPFSPVQAVVVPLQSSVAIHRIHGDADADYCSGWWRAQVFSERPCPFYAINRSSSSLFLLLLPLFHSLAVKFLVKVLKHVAATFHSTPNARSLILPPHDTCL